MPINTWLHDVFLIQALINISFIGFWLEVECNTRIKKKSQNPQPFECPEWLFWQILLSTLEHYGIPMSSDDTGVKFYRTYSDKHPYAIPHSQFQVPPLRHVRQRMWRGARGEECKKRGGVGTRGWFELHQKLSWKRMWGNKQSLKWLNQVC